MVVYDLNVVERQARKILEAFKIYDNFDLFYSMKANNSDEIVKVLCRKGLGASVSSEAELSKAIDLGFDSISYTAPYIPRSVLKNRNVEVNFNNYSEKKDYKKAGLRINVLIGWSYLPGTAASGEDSQFGVPIHELNSLDLSDVSRLHMHTSSDSYKIDLFLSALRNLLKIMKENPQIKTINIGGGVAVPIAQEDNEFDIKKFAKKIVGEINKFNSKFDRNVRLQFEPGNYLVRPSGKYICKIMAKEKKFGQIYYFTNGTKHHIKGINRIVRISLMNEHDNKELEKSVVVGRTCQRSDILFEGSLPELDIGDLISIPNVGAYCSVQSDSFHLLQKPYEIFTRNDLREQLVFDDETRL